MANTYEVVKNLRHDGKGYTPGKTVQLEDKHAEPLLKSGVIKPAEKKPAK